jgi:hypothetical protein
MAHNLVVILFALLLAITGFADGKSGLRGSGLTSIHGCY